MITVKDVCDFLEGIAPLELAEPWDNVGLQVGRESQIVERLLVCLDITDGIISEAESKKCQMIVAHHPLFFGDVRGVTDGTSVGRLALSAIEGGLAVYGAHTNLDKAPGGISDALADHLGLVNVSVLQNHGITELSHDVHPLEDRYDNEAGLGRLGDLKEEVGLDDFLKVCQAQISQNIRFAGSKKTVKRIAVCGGSGASLIETAGKAGADLMVTGDVKYHDVLRALDLGLVVVDAGHDSTEIIGMSKLSKRIEAELDIEVVAPKFAKSVWKVV